MLWVKTFHIVFVVSWFAGLFYLPRIFVNLAQIPSDTKHDLERQRLLLMANKLARFMLPLAVVAIVLGLVLWLHFGIGKGQTWMHAKIFIVFLLMGYHHACLLLLKKFNHGKNTRTHTWFRWFNEAPVLLLLGAVILVVVKPS
jgi:protoporphyrinogen IX oxidase